MKCADCRAFRVHLHEERLRDPAKRQKRCTILAGFTCDLFDKERPAPDIRRILDAATWNDDHTYVFLTKQPERMQRCLLSMDIDGELPYDNWYFGCTIRNQADADAKLPTFLTIPGKLWISYEPSWGPVDWGFMRDPKGLCGETSQYAWEDGTRPEGIICGHDNRKGAPGTDTLDHIRSTVQQCQAAGVRTYIKQLWLPGCTKCGLGPCTHRAVYKRTQVLVRDPQYFPKDLRSRDLPWGKQ